MSLPAPNSSTLRPLVDHAGFVVVAASAVALGTAFGSQIWGGLEPCVLCIYQRIAYAAVIVIGLAGTGFRALGYSQALNVFLFLAGVAFLAGAGVAGFHVGVEQHWWQGTTECTGATGATTLEDLEAQILGAPLTLCNEIAWSLFGVSMAGYNFIASIVLSAFAFYAASLRWQQ